MGFAIIGYRVRTPCTVNTQYTDNFFAYCFIRSKRLFRSTGIRQDASMCQAPKTNGFTLQKFHRNMRAFSEHVEQRCVFKNRAGKWPRIITSHSQISYAAILMISRPHYTAHTALHTRPHAVYFYGWLCTICLRTAPQHHLKLSMMATRVQTAYLCPCMFNAQTRPLNKSNECKKTLLTRLRNNRRILNGLHASVDEANIASFVYQVE